MNMVFVMINIRTKSISSYESLMFIILFILYFSFTGYDYGHFDAEPLSWFQFQNPQLFHGYQQGEGFDHLPSKQNQL